jgi:hypothetical protein
MSERWWAWSLSCLLIAQGWAQGLDTLALKERRAQHFLELDASGLYDSNTLRNDLVLGLWKGNTLDRGVRQRSDGQQGRENRAGYLLEGQLSYAWGDTLFGTPHMRPRIAVGYHDVMGLRYASDLYHVTFFGNAEFENGTAHLGPTYLEQVRYQTFGIGFEDTDTRSYLMVQLVNGQALNAARIEQADLFTATDGRYLQLDLNGSYARSDTAPTSGFVTQGMGLALSAQVNVPVRLGKHAGKITLDVQDFGAIAWNGESLRIPKDSTISYDGIRVVDVLDLNGVLIGSTSLQDTLGLNYRKGGFLRPLPTRLAARFSITADHAMTYEAQVDVRNLPGYLPHALIAAQHRFAGRNALRAEVSYGGFGDWRAGIGAERELVRGLRLGLRTSNALGWASGNARGKSLMLRLDYAW